MDTSQLIIDTAEKIFTDHCDKSLWDATEQGVFPCDLWRQLVENGFHQLGSANSGTETKDLFAFLKVCGRYAAPLPMAEILLANRWLGASAPAQGFASIGTQAGDSLVQVAWGRQVSPVLSVEAGSHDVSVFDAATLQQRGANLAGEPRDTMVAGAVSRRIELEDLPYAQMALARTNLMAGCLQAVLDLGLQFAAERSQFGRSISKFQAIQHSLAVVGTEVAASQRAADAGVDAMGTDRFEQEVAAAKARVGEAVGIVAEQVHQVHGAMGYTYEHRLHHFTRRLWAWRDEWGNEFYWQAKLGQHLAKLGADRVWGYIATPS
ncbi:MAG: acyl-CoA dehydrogenase family protein [Pseudomonadota bacterium]|nr:acyl-CoA dehydrogenase family protein [Pseudomonadota bacterium]MEC8618352.1 acyl-CoA dehydrogenase family protein [Pseudomonadota bacterium]MEC8619561.1 acyl-CoA dehydrogenase family protein [Pseudomonadota bacterium]